MLSNQNQETRWMMLDHFHRLSGDCDDKDSILVV